jgi:hypothetical protein
VKHHFTNSEQVAMEVYLGICEDLALPLSMQRMDSQEIKAGDWESMKDYNGIKIRLLIRTVVFYQGWGRIFVALKRMETSLGELIHSSTPQDRGNWEPVVAWLEEDIHRKEEWTRTAEYAFSSNCDFGGKALFYSPRKMYIGYAPSCPLIYMRRIKNPSWRSLAQSPGVP